MGNSKYEKVKSDKSGELVGNFGANYKAKYKELKIPYNKEENHLPNGHFKKGNSARDIAKIVEKEEKQRLGKMFRYYIDDEKFKQLSDAAFNMAINGDREMLKYMLDRMMGKEGQQSSLDVSVTENKIEWKYSFDATEENVKSINNTIINPDLPIIDSSTENIIKESSEDIIKEADDTTTMNG